MDCNHRVFFRLFHGTPLLWGTHPFCLSRRSAHVRLSTRDNMAMFWRCIHPKSMDAFRVETRPAAALLEQHCIRTCGAANPGSPDVQPSVDFPRRLRGGRGIWVCFVIALVRAGRPSREDAPLVVAPATDCRDPSLHVSRPPLAHAHTDNPSDRKRNVQRGKTRESERRASIYSCETLSINNRVTIPSRAHTHTL